MEPREEGTKSLFVLLSQPSAQWTRLIMSILKLNDAFRAGLHLVSAQTFIIKSVNSGINFFMYRLTFPCS